MRVFRQLTRQQDLWSLSGKEITLNWLESMMGSIVSTVDKRNSATSAFCPPRSPARGGGSLGTAVTDYPKSFRFMFFVAHNFPRAIVTVFSVLLLSGCHVGPDYHRPSALFQPQWKTASVSILDEPLGANQQWWADFNDPVLNRLVAEAVIANPDVKEAAYRVLESRSRYGITRADRLPSLAGAGDYSYRKVSGNSSPYSLLSQDAFNFNSLGFQSAWQVDVWGKFRRAMEAAAAEIQVSENDRHAIVLTLQSDVARTYIEIRAAQSRIRTAEHNLELQRRILEIAERRVAAGLSAPIDAEQARTSLHTVEAQLPTLTTQLQQAENKLAVLLGKPPQSLYDQWEELAEVPLAAGELLVGVPADLLRRRPDVRSAERALAAETARVGVAVADLYPQVSFRGTLSVDATKASTLFSGPSVAHDLGPSLSWNLFNFGQVRNQIAAQKARVNQALWRYRSKVLSAAEEVENALVAYQQEQLRLQALEKAVDAADRSVDLALKNYRQGLVRFQTVLDTQRTQLSLQDQRVVSRATLASQRVLLYAALGGGWTLQSLGLIESDNVDSDALRFEDAFEFHDDGHSAVQNDGTSLAKTTDKQ